MPRTVVADESHLYWTTATASEKSVKFGQILKRPLSGEKTVALVTWGKSEGCLAVDATHIYWMGRWNGCLFRVRKAGGDPEQLLSAENSFVGVDSFAADERFLYWTVADSARAGGAVWKLAK